MLILFSILLAVALVVTRVVYLYRNTMNAQAGIQTSFTRLESKLEGWLEV